jgi:tetratricopeptide (TPR) repeat protein
MMNRASPRPRKFGKLVVVVAIAGAGAAVALAFSMPTGKSPGKPVGKATAPPAPATPPSAPPSSTTPPPPPAPAQDAEGAQRLLVRARSAEEPAEQLELARQVLEKQPNCWEAFVFRSQVYDRLGEVGKALEEWTAAMGVHPQPLTLYERRAEFAARLGRHAQSAEDFGRALEAGPRVDLHVRRGVQWTLAGGTAAALESFEKALQMDARFVEAIGCRAAALALCGRADEALKGVQDALALDPTHAASHLAHAYVFARRAIEAAPPAGEPSVDALRRFADAASTAMADRLQVSSHDLLPLLERRLEEVEAQLAAWDKRGVKVGRAMSDGLAVRGAERVAQGQQLFTMAVRYDRSNALPHALHGFQQFVCCDATAARPYLGQAVRMAPDLPETRGLRGLLRLDHCMRSLAALSRGATPAPMRGGGAPDAQWPKAFVEACDDLQEYFSHAATRTEAARLEKMLADFVAMLGDVKTKPPPHEDVARRLAEHADAKRAACLDCAIGHASRAIAIHADGAAAWVSRGTSHAAASRWAEAVRDWEKAVALDGTRSAELGPLIAGARKKQR